MAIVRSVTLHTRISDPTTIVKVNDSVIVTYASDDVLSIAEFRRLQ